MPQAASDWAAAVRGQGPAREALAKLFDFSQDGESDAADGARWRRIPPAARRTTGPHKRRSDGGAKIGGSSSRGTARTKEKR